jgi:methylmalonyl-CoA mutase N-terminal domain/subunit
VTGPLKRNLVGMAPPEERRTDSGIDIRPLYTGQDLAGWDPDAELGTPGSFPYTRGIYPTMYRGRPWTIRQYSGFGTAESTNERWRLLLAAGGTGL